MFFNIEVTHKTDTEGVGYGGVAVMVMGIKF
jgi:hypothetical protein